MLGKLGQFSACPTSHACSTSAACACATSAATPKSIHPQRTCNSLTKHTHNSIYIRSMSYFHPNSEQSGGGRQTRARRHHFLFSAQHGFGTYVGYARRMGQSTQRATNYTARSNIDPKYFFTPTANARPDQAAFATSAETRGATHRARPRSPSNSGFGLLRALRSSTVFTYSEPLSSQNGPYSRIRLYKAKPH